MYKENPKTHQITRTNDQINALISQTKREEEKKMEKKCEKGEKKKRKTNRKLVQKVEQVELATQKRMQYPYLS